MSHVLRQLNNQPIINKPEVTLRQVQKICGLSGGRGDQCMCSLRQGVTWIHLQTSPVWRGSYPSVVVSIGTKDRVQSPLEKWLSMISMNRPKMELRPYEFLLQLFFLSFFPFSLSLFSSTLLSENLKNNLQLIFHYN